MTEAQKNRKLKKIERMKKALRAEKLKYGDYDDSYGRRYSIAELYFEIADYSKTNRYLNWFNKNFPDDFTYAYFQLGAAVTYFEVNKLKKAKEAIVNLNNINLYVVDLILGHPLREHNKYEFNPISTLAVAVKQKEMFQNLSTDKFLIWLKELHGKEKHQMWFKKYLSILKLLKGLDVSKERSDLLDASDKCIEDWVGDDY